MIPKMKKINRTLLLLVGITVNVLIACGSSDDQDAKEPYSSYDTTRPVEYKNDNDTLSSQPGAATDRQMAE